MTRVVNKRKERYDFYIGRGSPFGNPFSHLSGTKATYQVGSREEAIEAYRRWIVGEPEVMRLLPKIRGLTLGCFCKPKSCHGDVLVELLNTYSDEQLYAWVA
jgi:hypothetical protein